MSQEIISPSTERPKFASVFLAGGITNCNDWQSDVMQELKSENITIFNPRCKHFDVSDPSASEKQIVWEYERLEQMDIFSIYFCNSVSNQPISLYELGRNIVRMQNRFPSDWQDRIVVSVENGYSRTQDIVVQLGLCAPDLVVDTTATPKKHAGYISSKFLWLNTFK